MFRFKKKSLIYVIIFVILLVLLSSLLVPALKTPSLNVLKYPLSLLRLIRREFEGIIFYHRNLIQNERLKKELGLLRQKINTLNETDFENKRLKELLSFKQKSPYKVIAARVIARSPDNWSSVIVIDKGSFQGIKRGFIVIKPEGLLGCVIETQRYTSKVMLINDLNLSVSAIVQRSRQEGLVSGTLDNSLIMRYLPKNSDIKVSDIIVTSGLTNMYPKGLVIGTVISIGEEFSGLTRYAIIKPAVNLSNIEEVLIIIR